MRCVLWDIVKLSKGVYSSRLVSNICWGLQNEMASVLKNIDGWGGTDNAMPVAQS